MEKLTLAQLQEYVAKKSAERGFQDESPRDILLLMTEELGELARAIRKNSGLKMDGKSKVYAIEEEIADILIYLLHLSNVLKIDINEAFWEKEEENNSRKWN